MKLTAAVGIWIEGHYERACDLTWDPGGSGSVEYFVGDDAQINEAPARDIQTVIADDHLDWRVVADGRKFRLR